MEKETHSMGRGGTSISLDIPAKDANLFRSETLNETLSFLCRYPDEAFSITELTDAIDRSRHSISNAVDVLAANDLVVEFRDGNARRTHINRDRLSRPDDPILQIPQSEFHPPVRAAVEELEGNLDDVLGIVLYGSVARGEADRRSDVDLWVLVEDDRMENQRAANDVREDLEEVSFPGGRFAFDVDVETLQAVPNYAADLREVLTDGLVVSGSEKFETVRTMVFHGELDE